MVKRSVNAPVRQTPKKNRNNLVDFRAPSRVRQRLAEKQTRFCGAHAKMCLRLQRLMA